MILAFFKMIFILFPFLIALYLLIQGIRKRKIHLIIFPLMFIIVSGLGIILFLQII